jgi:hypothetical protein
MHGWRMCCAQCLALGTTNPTLSSVRAQHSAAAVGKGLTISHGLFGHDDLRNPGDWDTVAEKAIARSARGCLPIKFT